VRLRSPSASFGSAVEVTTLRLARALDLHLLQEAAVAVVLRGGSLREAEVLLVRRALKAGDPWSGHVALPGGRRAASDVDLLATALRETHEEVGLALALEGRQAAADRLVRGQLLGTLPPVYTVAPARDAPLGLAALPMVVRPYVLRLDGPAEPRLSSEVTGIRWVPLAALHDPARRTQWPWRFLGVQWPAPAWDLDGDIVWGLTHQMLSALLRALH